MQLRPSFLFWLLDLFVSHHSDTGDAVAADAGDAVAAAANPSVVWFVRLIWLVSGWSDYSLPGLAGLAGL